MKKTAIIISFILAGLAAFAKGSSGLYKDLDDYTHNRMSYPADCSGHYAAVHFKTENLVASTVYVRVKENGKKYKLNKNDLYGYRDCAGRVYRFYKNKEYRIEEAAGIYIYSRREQVAYPKKFEQVTVYYFSKGPGSDIITLSSANINEAYAANTRFMELLNENDARANLAAYDGYRKSYRINTLFSKAMLQ